MNRKVIVYKTDSETTPTPLAGAQFTINNTTLTSGQNGYTALIELPTSGTPYDLVETESPAGYNKLTSAVKVTVSSSGVTYIQSEYNAGQPQTAQTDKDGNYIIWIRNSSGVELPSTGSSRTLLYTALGLTMLLTVGAMLTVRTRKEN